MTDFDLGPDVITRVREASDIVAVISDLVRMKRRGRTWEGLCPFHDEKTPSFTVDAEKGLYYCFGCHQGGDVFKFVMTQQNRNFPEAVEYLARRFGVDLPARSPGAQRRRREAERQQAILEEAQRWFVDQLQTPGGVPAARELERRGFPKDTWSDFGFGWAPDEWRGLTEHLRSRHPEGILAQAGLIVQPESGKNPYDRFRKRLMFPIRSGDGRLIAFGGRILGDGEPKYLNSPEGPLFHKRSTLFALDRARKAIATHAEVVVVEGYFDCLSLQRVEILNVVATLGTALTPDHGRMLRRLLGEDGRVLLCYDGDAAGRRAATTGAGVLLQAGVEVAVITPEAGRDPDDIVREDGVESFAALMESPTPLLDFLLSDLPPEPTERRKAGFALAPLVCGASNPAIRQNLVDELARRLDLRPRDIESRGRQPRRSGGPPPPDARASVRQPMPSGEKDLARIIIDGTPEFRSEVLERVPPESMTDERVRALIDCVRQWGPEADVAVRIMTDSEDEVLKTFVAQIGASGGPPISAEGVAAALNVIARRQNRAVAQGLQEQIEQAAAQGDFERLAELQAEKVKLRRS